MKQLELAKQSAIQLGGTITNNDVGFITCFDSSDTANNYALYVNDNLADCRTPGSLCRCGYD